MADLIKKIKIKKQDGTFTDYIPIGAEATNISTDDGDSIQLKINKKPYYYDTVADMKADTKLKVGDMAITLGYYEPGDGGGATYRIVNTSSDLTVILNNGLLAKLNVDNGVIKVKQLGAYGDGEHDDTNAIQNAINIANTIIFNENSTYMINAVDSQSTGSQIHSNIIYNGGLKISSNKELIGEKNSILKAFSNNSSNYVIFRCCQVENISIKGLTILGDKDTHIGSSGEYGHGIMILNSKNINISNCYIGNTWGDCIYIGVLYNSEATEKTGKIYVNNCIINNARRNGIACCSGNNIIIENNTISETSGTNPQCGVDIESEGYLPELKNIKIINNIFNNNKYGLTILFSNTNVDFESINIENNNYNQGLFGIMIYPTASFNKILKGKINIQNNSFIENGWSSIVVRNYYSDKLDFLMINNNYILNCNNTNHNIDTNSTGYTGGSGVVINRTSEATSKVGNIIVSNLEVVDNRETKYINKAFVVVDSTNNNIENVYFINPIKLECVNGFSNMKETIIQDIRKIIYTNGTYYEYTLNKENIFPLHYTSNCTDTIKSYVLDDEDDYIINETEYTIVNDGGKKTQLKMGKNNAITLYNAPDSTMRYLRCTANDIGAYVKIKKIKNKWMIIEKQGNWTSSNNSY